MKTILISIKVKKDKYRNSNYILENNWINYFFKKKIKLIPVNYKLFRKKDLDDLKPVGIILAGGNDLSSIIKNKENILREKNDNFLLNYGLKKRLPVLGVCYGFQFIAKKYQCRLFKVKGHIKKYHNLNFKNYKLNINSFHNYGIYKLPSNFNILAKCNDETIELAEYKKKKILCCMFHPERHNKTQKLVDKIILKHFKIS